MPELVEIDAVDEERWYKMQSHGQWYAVRGCCRRCATRHLQAWTNAEGEVKTVECPNFIVKLRGAYPENQRQFVV